MKVALIEDSPLLCQHLDEALGALDGVEVVGCAGDETAAVELLLAARPDLAIIDLHLRQGSGLGVLRALAGSPARFGPPRAVVFTNHQHPGIHSRCLALGVERIFDKAAGLEELLSYVRAALPA